MEKTRYKVTAWIIGLLGVWLMVAGSVIKAANGNLVINLSVGLVVVFFGMLLSRVRKVRGWLSYIFGAWMIIAAFMPAFLVGTGHVWNNVILGILTATAGFTALRDGLSTLRIPRG